MICSRARARGRAVRRRRRPRTRAAERMHALGYQDAAILDGSLAAREAAGYRVDSGVHVVGEHEARARLRDCAGIECAD